MQEIKDRDRENNKLKKLRNKFNKKIENPLVAEIRDGLETIVENTYLSRNIKIEEKGEDPYLREKAKEAYQSVLAKSDLDVLREIREKVGNGDNYQTVIEACLKAIDAHVKSVKQDSKRQKRRENYDERVSKKITQSKTGIEKDISKIRTKLEKE